MHKKWETELLERGPSILACSIVMPTEVITILPKGKGITLSEVDKYNVV